MLPINLSCCGGTPQRTIADSEVASESVPALFRYKDFHFDNLKRCS